MWFKTYNQAYWQLLKKIKNSSDFNEIKVLEEKLVEFKTKQLSKKFKNNQSPSHFKIIEILMKNPVYLNYKKHWVMEQSRKNIDFWEVRINYWEPLFIKFKSPLCDKIETKFIKQAILHT